MIGELNLTCDNPKCPEVIKLHKFQEHICNVLDSPCAPPPAPSPASATQPISTETPTAEEENPTPSLSRATAVRELLATQPGVVTKEMEEVGTFILKALMAQSPDGQTALFKTGGQVG